MELKRKLIGIAGSAMLLAGMTAGVATAQVTDSDTMQTSVQITCPVPATVALGGDVAFDPITDIINDHDTQTAPGAIEVTVDMGCYWGPWQVNAYTTNFVAGPFMWFSADHLSLVDANVDSYFLDPIDGPFDFLEPEASNAYFNGAGPINQETILETDENWIWWPWIQGPDDPAPFVTEASYTGQLTNLPILLTGNYVATLTVELATD